MAKKIFLDSNMDTLSIEINPKTDLCNISANLKNGGKRLLLKSIPYLQARSLYSHGCLELNKLKKGIEKNEQSN